MEWLINNKEWIFSGIGITVISAVICLLKRKSDKLLTLKQKSGKNSINIQVGGDSNIEK